MDNGKHRYIHKMVGALFLLVIHGPISQNIY
jgi:hypothetical protein